MKAVKALINALNKADQDQEDSEERYMVGELVCGDEAHKLLLEAVDGGETYLLNGKETCSVFGIKCTKAEHLPTNKVELRSHEVYDSKLLGEFEINQ